MHTEHLIYSHTGEDPIRHTSFEVTGHADPTTALVVAQDSADEGAGSHALYIHQDDVAGAVVALLTNTRFVEAAPTSKHDERLIAAAQGFIDAFREAMVPTFRERFQKAMDEATSDWDLKCRMSRIVDDYENLR